MSFTGFLHLQRYKDHIIALGFIFAILLVFYYPVWFKNELPLNASFLVSFYSPWKFAADGEYRKGVPTKQGGGYDTLRIGYPYMGLVRTSWKKGEVPLWNQYNFSGLPLAAESQSAAFYPLQVFGLFFSQENLWIIFTISGFFFCYFFTYLYLKNRLQSLLPSIFGAFSFSFCTFFIAWNQEVVTAIHAVLWLPLILFALDKLVISFRLRWWIILLFSLCMTILSGYVQMTIYVLCLFFFYLLWMGMTSFNKIGKKIMFMLVGSAAFICSLFLTLFQTLPLYEMYTLSSRNIVNMQSVLIGYLLPPYSLIQLIIPDFFGNSGTWNHFGIVSGGSFYEHTYSFALPTMLFFAYYLLVDVKNRDKYFFLLLGICSLLFALDTPFSRWIFFSGIPVLSTSISNRILFIPLFCFSILASYGLKLWMDVKNYKKGLHIIIVLLFFSILYLFTIKWLWTMRQSGFVPKNFIMQWADVAFRNSLPPILLLVISASVIIICFFKGHLKRVGAIIFILICIGQIYYFFQKTTAFSNRTFLYPDDQIFSFLKKNAGLNRFWSVGDAAIENNIASQMKVFSLEGYDSLADRRYAQLLKTSETDGIWSEKDLSRSDVGIYKGNSSKLFEENFSRLRLLQLTSTKYILYKAFKDSSNEDRKKMALPSSLFSSIATISGIEILEYKNRLPRALLVPSAIILKSEQDILNALFKPTFNPTKQIVIESDRLADTADDPSSTVKILKYGANTGEIEIQTGTSQWLLLTDSYNQGWKAFIDGTATQIYRANFAFRAVLIPKGKHIVRFSYEPESFYRGLKGSLGTAIFLILVCVVWIIKTKKVKIRFYV